MKSHAAGVVTALGIVFSLAATSLSAQQAPAAREFDAEIRAAVQSAKTAAGFEFLGTLVRTCLLPQSNFQVMQGCARAAQLGLEQKLAGARTR